MSGMAEGLDLLAAEVIKAKEYYPDIELHTVTAFAGQSDRMCRESKLCYDAILSAADSKICLSDTYYGGCLLKGNDYLIENSTQLIAYYDNVANGGTHYTVEYAIGKGIDVFNLFDIKMDIFNFYQDEQIKGWARSAFYVKAFSYPQAVENIRLLDFHDVNELNTDFIVPLGYEYLTEPVETLSLKDSKAITTIEYYSTHDKSKPLFTNKDARIIDERKAKLNELACILAEKNMVDVFKMLPCEFMDKKNPDIYAEVYQKKYDEYLKYYINQLSTL